jgi:hypothetical protein
VHVFQLLHMLALCEDVEVIIARLPEGPFAAMNRNRKLQRLDCLGQDSPLRFTDQQMHMFRHHDIAENTKVIPDTNRFQGTFKEVTSLLRIKMRLPSIATEGDKVEVSGVLIADQFLSHAILLHILSERLRRFGIGICDVRGNPGLKRETWGTLILCYSDLGHAPSAELIFSGSFLL